MFSKSPSSSPTGSLGRRGLRPSSPLARSATNASTSPKPKSPLSPSSHRRNNSKHDEAEVAVDKGSDRNLRQGRGVDSFLSPSRTKTTSKPNVGPIPGFTLDEEDNDDYESQDQAPISLKKTQKFDPGFFQNTLRGAKSEDDDNDNSSVASAKSSRSWLRRKDDKRTRDRSPSTTSRRSRNSDILSGLDQSFLEPLEEKVEVREIPKTSADQVHKWMATFTTGKERGADTRARISLDIYGLQGMEGDVRVNGDGEELRVGSEYRITFYTRDLGALWKIRLQHDNSGTGSSWQLDNVVLTRFVESNNGSMPTTPTSYSPTTQRRNKTAGKITKYVFHCKQWIGGNDRESLVELPATIDENIQQLPWKEKPKLLKYSLEVYTGKEKNASTDADVFVILKGTLGDTGPRHLANSQHFDKFEKGKMDRFEISAVSLGTLTGIRVWHNKKRSVTQRMTGKDSAWLLDKIVVVDPSLPGNVEFPCGHWFDDKKGDGRTQRDLVPLEDVGGKENNTPKTPTTDDKLENTMEMEKTNKKAKYIITTMTGKLPESDTVAQIFIKLHGKGKSNISDNIFLQESNNDIKFEQGQKDIFKVTAKDLGEEGVQKITLWHNSTFCGDDWYLDYVTVQDVKRKTSYRFSAKKWFSEPPNETTLKRPVITNYGTTTLNKSGDLEQSGTTTTTTKKSRQQGKVTTTGLWMVEIEHENKQKHSTTSEGESKYSLEGTASAKGWLEKVKKREQEARKKKKQQELQRKQEEEAKAEAKLEAKKAHETWIKRKQEQAKKEKLQRKQEMEKTMQSTQSLTTHKTQQRTARGLDRNTWTQKKLREKENKMQIQMAIEIHEAEEAKRQQAISEERVRNWEKQRVRKEKEFLRQEIKKEKREVSEARRINQSLKKPTYYNPIPHGDKLHGGYVHSLLN
eukprot:m.252843 g.252843  ORF g.252843 m.252843 type:complete len:913 (+) comp16157_c2_seq4:201-2939(+)